MTVKKRGMVFVVSGPSGSGKTTLVERILRSRKLGSRLTRSISFTTRPKRSGEIEGRHYFFVSRQDFKRALGEKKILEWTDYLGYYYATPRDFFETQISHGKNLILCLDIKGAARVKRAYPRNTVTVFVLPPSLGVLGERIRRRCSRTKKAEILKRVKLAEKELRSASKFDYCLVNEDLNKVAAELKTIISCRLCKK